MFTGLIETTGEVRAVTRNSGSICLSVMPKAADFAVGRGDSVCVDGVCLTVEEKDADGIRFRAVHETLRVTTLSDLRPGRTVNLERSLRLADRFGGHFVLGHVDCVGRIGRDRTVGECLYRTIAVTPDAGRLAAPKGSVALDGISLTVVESTADSITVALIPHTLKETTMSGKRAGDRVNVECDVLARYVEHQLRHGTDAGSPGGGETLYTKLARLGF